MRSRNAESRSEDARELSIVSPFQSFDERPLPELDSEASDFRTASESFEPIWTLARRDLTSLGIVNKHQFLGFLGVRALFLG